MIILVPSGLEHNGQFGLVYDSSCSLTYLSILEQIRLLTPVKFLILQLITIVNLRLVPI